MEAIRQLCGFAAGLERLLVAKSAAELEATWDEQKLGPLGWEALALARRANNEALEPALTVVDRRLLAALERCRAFLEPHIVTFRVPELERWQHAAAAALVGFLVEGLVGPLAPPADAAKARDNVQTVTLLALRALGVVDARARGLVVQSALPRPDEDAEDAA